MQKCLLQTAIQKLQLQRFSDSTITVKVISSTQTILGLDKRLTAVVISLYFEAIIKHIRIIKLTDGIVFRINFFYIILKLWAVRHICMLVSLYTLCIFIYVYIHTQWNGRRSENCNNVENSHGVEIDHHKRTLIGFLCGLYISPLLQGKIYFRKPRCHRLLQYLIM